MRELLVTRQLVVLHLRGAQNGVNRENQGNAIGNIWENVFSILNVWCVSWTIHGLLTRFDFQKNNFINPHKAKQVHINLLTELINSYFFPCSEVWTATLKTSPESERPWPPKIPKVSKCKYRMCTTRRPSTNSVNKAIPYFANLKNALATSVFCKS